MLAVAWILHLSDVAGPLSRSVYVKVAVFHLRYTLVLSVTLQITVFNVRLQQPDDTVDMIVATLTKSILAAE